MRGAIIYNGEKYQETGFKNEANLTEIFEKNYKSIISEKSFFIPLAKQFKTKKFKNYRESIGDGFFILWENPDVPVFYIVEIELTSHSLRHILPQLGNFISFIQSATTDERMQVIDYIYEIISNNKGLLAKIQQETGKEARYLLDEAMKEIQILLVIDKIDIDLSIGLKHIERAINVKIRKIEISSFINNKGKEIILYSDSEIEEESDAKLPKDFYDLDYHIDNKSDGVKKIVKEFIKYTQKKKVDVSYQKHYIGFFKEDKMIFSCVPKKDKVIFYSKALIKQIPIHKSLFKRDVRKIGHLTNHLPTEIIIENQSQLKNLFSYFDKVYRKF